VDRLSGTKPAILAGHARQPFTPLFPLDFLIWIALGICSAVIGAYVVVFRLDRRLHKVLDAARTIGRGETPETLAEAGPAEIRDLSRGFNQMASSLQNWTPNAD